MFVFVTILQPDSGPESSSFRRPQTEVNIASGCPQFALQYDVESYNFPSMTHEIHSGRRLKLGVTPYLSDKVGDWEFGPHKMDTHFQNALRPCCGLHVTLTVVHNTPV